MEIIPNSTVKLFKNVPLNADYHDTLWWANKGLQYSYFNNLPGKVFNQLTYVRKERNTIRLECKMEDVYDCNYMAFLNTNFVNKWFYAFVLDVNYINNETCEIVYQIDAVQTWFFEMDFEDCFIERQHSTTDGVGDNIVPENLGKFTYVDNANNELISMNNEFAKIFNTLCVIAITAEDTSSTEIIPDVDGNDEIGDEPSSWSGGDVYSGTYSGLKYILFQVMNYNSAIHVRTLSDYATNGLNQWLEEMFNENKENSIIALVMFPKDFCNIGDTIDTQRVPILPNAYGKTISKTASVQTLQSGDLDGYIPKNKKLYTYPYNCIYCTIGDNISKTIRIEKITSGSYKIDCLGSLSISPEITISIGDYKENNQYDTRMTMSSYHQCAWVGDSYKYWQANEGKRMANNLLTDTINGGANALMSLGTNLLLGGMVGGAVGAVSEMNGISNTGGFISNTVANVMRYYNEEQIAQTVGDKGHGTNANSTDLAFATKYPHSYQYCYDARDLKRIDDYFTMYGYAQGVVGKPNLHARSKWTYVKTKGCQIHGQMPTIVQNTLEGIFNNGIRFWTSPSYIGNYNQSNNVLS